MIRLFFLACGLLAAQDTQNAQTAPTAPDAEQPAKPYPYVRRFSAGGTLGISIYSLMKNVSISESGTNRSATYRTEPKGYRFGGGGTAQVAVSDRFAVAASAVLRRVRFATDEEVTESSKTTKKNEFTSGDFWEFPLVVRRYSKSRLEGGGRWFAEGGLALRRARNIRGSIETTDSSNKTTCCDERPVTPANRLATGVTIGGGYQIVDQFGLRLVPNIRYTRWTSSSFDARSVQSNRSQLEAGFSITF